MGEQRFELSFPRLLTAAGAVVCFLAAARLDLHLIDVQFLLLTSFTIAIGSRIGISIPKTQAEITASDTLVFLTLLLYGGETAILLAAAEAFCSSFRFTSRWRTRFLNAALLAVSTATTACTLRLCFGPVTALVPGKNDQPLLIAALLMATLQYGINSGLAAFLDSRRTGKHFWPVWRTHYLWTSITYFAGASAAVIIAKLSGTLGFYAFIFALPIIAIIYFTYQTYRKNIEAAEHFGRELQESEAQFRGAFDHAAIGMALVGLDGRWLRVNDSLCRLVGYEAGELLARRYQDITHPDDLSGNEKQARGLLEGAVSSFHMEKRYVHQSGELVWVMLSVSLVRNAQGTPLYFITQVQDITDRKRAEQRLQHDAFHDALTGLPNRALFKAISSPNHSPRAPRANYCRGRRSMPILNMNAVSHRQVVL